MCGGVGAGTGGPPPPLEFPGYGSYNGKILWDPPGLKWTHPGLKLYPELDSP